MKNVRGRYENYVLNFGRNLWGLDGKIDLLLFLITRQITRCCNTENRNTKEKLQLGRPNLDGMIIFKGIYWIKALKSSELLFRRR
jgi:hypothetical protein